MSHPLPPYHSSYFLSDPRCGISQTVTRHEHNAGEVSKILPVVAGSVLFTLTLS